MTKNITNYIKTECGLSKYHILKSNKGFLSNSNIWNENKLRFYWFVIFASIRDLPKFRQD